MSFIVDFLTAKAAQGDAGDNSIGTLLGAKETSPYASMYSQAPNIQDTRNYSDMSGLLNALNARKSGQVPYEDFITGFQNPYIQNLIGRG